MVASCLFSSSTLTSQAKSLAQRQWTVLRCGWQDHENLQSRNRTVGEALTGIQAVVTVGILHLQHQARENPVRPLPLGRHQSVNTYTTGAGTTEWLSQGLARPRGRRPLCTLPTIPAPTPRSSTHAPFVSPPWHRPGESCLLCSPGGRTAGETLGIVGEPRVFRTPYVHEPDPPSPRRRARPRSLP